MLPFLFTLLTFSPTPAQTAPAADPDYEAFKVAVMQRVRDLEAAIKVITNRTFSEDIRYDAVDVATSYFASANQDFEVSNVKTKKVRVYPVNTYLSRLYNLPYDVTTIDWVDFRWASELYQTPNGDYNGSVQVIQRFRGKIDGKIVYTDLTTKTIDITVRTHTMDLGDRTEEVIQIELRDVKVSETKQ